MDDYEPSSRGMTSPTVGSGSYDPGVATGSLLDNLDGIDETAADLDEGGVSRAVLVALDPLRPEDVAATVHALRTDLSVGTQTDGRSVVLDRAAVAAALDRSPQRYVDATRVLVATRRELRAATDRRDSEMAAMRRSAMSAITADPKRQSKARPEKWVIEDWVLTNKATQVRGLNEAVGDAEDAVKAAEALVRAYNPATREATLRRFLDDH